MKKHHQIFAASILSLSLTAAYANSALDNLNRLATTSMPTSMIGVMVMDADSGKTLYQYQASKAFTPASVMKILAGGAALRVLGAQYQYNTTISIKKNELRDHTLHGNLYITFSGDPSLKVTDVQKMITAIHQQGVNHITGNVVIDDTRFQAPDQAPGWTNDSLYWAYSAPITTVILNKNLFSVNFIPDKTVGGPVVITPGLNMQYMQLKSHIRSVTYKQSMTDCSLVLHIDRENTLQLGGCWPNNVGGWQTFSVPNPTLLAQKMVAQSLKMQNIALDGKVITGKTPDKLTAIAEHASAPLENLLKHMLKASDNIYAGSVTKTLGSVNAGQGTFLQGVNTIKQNLGPLTHVNFANTVISDGSGQSRYDLLTPQQLTQVLYGLYHDPKTKTDFMNTLPISGTDGTLKYRMGDQALLGKVRAKTGSMKGISTLAGYLTAANGHTIIFAIMVNNISGKLHPARVLEDQMCAQMYQLDTGA